MPILEALGDLLPRVKVSISSTTATTTGRNSTACSATTHLLMHGLMMVHLGEVTYLAKDAIESESQLDRKAIEHRL